jgi:L-threonylcarbamoyladenylate synthase
MGTMEEVRVSGQLVKAKLMRNKQSFQAIQSAIITFVSIISNCTASIIKDAALALKQGHLVAFPTETVYGLGADATNEKAVARIYEAKGRPTDHPLIVHISSMEFLDKWAGDIQEYAIKLARTFWPGPMTLVLKRTELAKDFITGGQDSVGIRIPGHTVALALLQEFESQGGCGIAAPSANRFGKVSPTTALAVSEELSNFLTLSDRILDGGLCEVGLESTIIDCTQQQPVIIRPGSVTTQVIEKLLSIKLPIFGSQINRVKASGLLKSHYAPNTKVFLTGTPAIGDGLIALSKFPTPPGVIRLAAPNSNEEYARVLYQALRLADTKKLDKLFVIAPDGDDIAVAICDRLKKASETQ